MPTPEPRFAPDTPDAEKGAYQHDEYGVYHPGDVGYHGNHDDQYEQEEDDGYGRRNPHSPDSDYDSDGLPPRHPTVLRPTSARPLSAHPGLDPLPFQQPAAYAGPVNIDDKLDTPGWGPGSAMAPERPRSRGPPPDRPVSRGPPPERPLSRNEGYGFGRGQAQR